jgi:hypothetical protein
LSPSPLIDGATGIYTDHAYFPGLYHPVFAKVLQQYTNRDPILFPAGTCNGNCEVEVSASGWDIECSNTSEPQRLATYFELEDYYKNGNTFGNGTQRSNSTYDGPKPVQTVFDVKSIFNYTYGSTGIMFQGYDIGSYVSVECSDVHLLLTDDTTSVRYRLPHHVSPPKIPV